MCHMGVGEEMIHEKCVMCLLGSRCSVNSNSAVFIIDLESCGSGRVTVAQSLLDFLGLT
jgi:hypothetical protein